MKKNFYYMSLLLGLFFGMTMFTACGGDDDGDDPVPVPPTPQPESATLIGKWTLDWGTNSFMILTFDSNGKVRIQEYDNNQWEEDAVYNYTYSNGTLTFTYDDGKLRDKAGVVSLSTDKLVLKDWPDMGENTFGKYVDETPNTPPNAPNESASLIGKWTLGWGTNNFMTLTFDSNGKVRIQEYDNNQWEEDAVYNYTYSNGTLTFTYDDGKLRDKAGVVSLSTDKLVLKDWPDMGENTFEKE